METNPKNELLYGKPNTGLSETTFTLTPNNAVDLRIIAVSAGLIDKYNYKAKFKICVKSRKLADGTVQEYDSLDGYGSIEQSMLGCVDSNLFNLKYNPNNWALVLDSMENWENVVEPNDKKTTAITFYLSVC